MKMAISKEHRYFFNEKGYINFDPFLTKDQVSSLNKAIDETISSKDSAEEQFINGRDLWRRNQEIQKWAGNLRIAELLAELTSKHPVRLGYDQLIPAIPKRFFEGAYQTFISKQTSLEAISSIRGVLGGVLIGLTSFNGETSQDDPFPKHAGSVTFFNASNPIDWSKLAQREEQRFYMVVYCESLTFYVPKGGDIHNDDWKKFYVFNDKLVDKWNPIVFW